MNIKIKNELMELLPQDSTIVPRDYQIRVIEKLVQQQRVAIFHHMGRGKTLTTALAGALLSKRGAVNLHVVIAPNFIKHVWAREYGMLKDGLARVFVMRGGLAHAEKARQWLIDHRKNHSGLPVVVVSVESLSNTAFADWVERVVKVFGRAFVSVDESTTIKNHKAKRTKNIIRIGDAAKYKAILTGTPIAKGVEDMFTQARFLGPDVLPYRNFYQFRAAHCVMGGFENRQIVGYRGVDALMNMLSPVADIEEVNPADFPKRTWSVIPVELSQKQLDFIESLWADYFAEYGGHEIETTAAVSSLLYCTMAAGGVIPVGDGGYVPVVKNPKLDAMLEQIELLPLDEKVIIWARFRGEFEQIVAVLQRKYGKENVCRFYGEQDYNERIENNNHFQNGTARFMVSTYAGARGQTWTAAQHAIFYSNEFSYEVRTQAEARNWGRDNADHEVHYYDLVANHWTDKLILNAITKKQNIADLIKDELKKARGNK